MTATKATTITTSYTQRFSPLAALLLLSACSVSGTPGLDISSLISKPTGQSAFIGAAKVTSDGLAYVNLNLKIRDDRWMPSYRILDLGANWGTANTAVRRAVVKLHSPTANGAATEALNYRTLSAGDFAANGVNPAGWAGAALVAGERGTVLSSGSGEPRNRPFPAFRPANDYIGTLYLQENAAGTATSAVAGVVPSNAVYSDHTGNTNWNTEASAIKTFNLAAGNNTLDFTLSFGATAVNLTVGTSTTGNNNSISGAAVGGATARYITKGDKVTFSTGLRVDTGAGTAGFAALNPATDFVLIRIKRVAGATDGYPVATEDVVRYIPRPAAGSGDITIPDGTPWDTAVNSAAFGGSATGLPSTVFQTATLTGGSAATPNDIVMLVEEWGDGISGDTGAMNRLNSATAPFKVLAGAVANQVKIN
jgi:hypothetical protein